jgi:hypothetical protein
VQIFDHREAVAPPGRAHSPRSVAAPVARGPSLVARRSRPVANMPSQHEKRNTTMSICVFLRLVYGIKRNEIKERLAGDPASLGYWIHPRTRCTPIEAFYRFSQINALNVPSKRRLLKLVRQNRSRALKKSDVRNS